jgi:hypothetical protein
LPSGDLKSAAGAQTVRKENAIEKNSFFILKTLIVCSYKDIAVAHIICQPPIETFLLATERRVSKQLLNNNFQTHIHFLEKSANA